MQHELNAILSPVRLRQRLNAGLRGAMWGLFISAVAAASLAVWKWTTGSLPATGWVVTLLLAGPLCGALIGLIRQHTWRRAATAVDHQYDLKDRTVTALHFLGQAQQSDLHQLQVSETLSQLSRVDARQVVPYGLPSWSRWAMGASALALVFLVWPIGARIVEATIERPSGIDEAVTAISEDLQQLKEVAEETQQEDLAAVLEKLEMELETLREPETDIREALATISEMQAELAEQMKQYNTAAVDAQMQALAEALSSAEAFQGAALQLKEGNYDKAAEELDKLENVEMDRKESRAASEKLAEASSAIKKAGMGKLGDSVGELSEACKECNSDKIGDSTKSLAGQCRNQGLRKSLSQLLGKKLDRLSECKSMCQGGQCKSCGGNCKSGQCQSNKNSLAKGQTNSKSNNASKNWGSKSHGNLDGEKTAIDATRTQEQVTGTLGDGPSDFETSNSPEGQEQARRGYKESYNKYKKLSDAVLESEPIPLGQRQLIRNYFEIIRPDQSEDRLTQPTE